MNILLDSNIIIDLLNGETKARDYLLKLQELNISSITVYEVLSGCVDARVNQLKAAELLFNKSNVIPVSEKISARAAQYQRRWKLKRKMADFLIEATAYENGLNVSTRNPKDFKHAKTVIPYTL